MRGEVDTKYITKPHWGALETCGDDLILIPKNGISCDTRKDGYTEYFG